MPFVSSDSLAEKALSQSRGRVQSLLLDLNSFFASVEQQEDPRLRNRPVAVVPVETDFTSVIAASYEAKVHGVKTGTNVGEARRMCPGLVCVLARHDRYVDYHHRIIDEVDRHVPVDEVLSIDEMHCRLTGWRQEPDAAHRLARQVKEALRREIGESIRCSIGLAPNRLLAKIASNLQKPDGLVWLRAEDLPGRLLDLSPRDLPGIGASMQVRLARAGIHTVKQLWESEPARLKAVWGGVPGERFWYALHGLDVPDVETQRHSVGHSHVLGPDYRAPGKAEVVAKRLMLKAASRLRRMSLQCGRVTLSARFENGGRLERSTKVAPLNDSFQLLQVLSRLWRQPGGPEERRRFLQVGVTFGELTPVGEGEQLEMFPDLLLGGVAPELRQKHLRLSRAMDEINGTHGRDSVALGFAPDHVRAFSGPKIAFSRIPERREFVE